MSRKSSIHFKPVSNVRFAVSHSERTDLSEPAYLLPKEHQLNNVVVAGSLSENELAALFIQQKEGMSRQAKTAGASPFWEGVVVLADTDAKAQSANLQAWKVAYEKATGHKVLHISIHLDEGYMGTDGKPVYNPHAHAIVSRMDSKNRVIHLDRKQLAAVQDLTAETLKMQRGSTLAERGGKRGRAHIGHKEFRAQANEARLDLDGEKAKTAFEAKLTDGLSGAHRDTKAKLKKVQVVADRVPQLEAKVGQQAQQITDLAVKHTAEIAAIHEQNRLDRETLKASGIAKQADYMALKKDTAAALAAQQKAHEAEVAELKTVLAEALAIVEKLTTDLAKAQLEAAGQQIEVLQKNDLATEAPAPVSPERTWPSLTEAEFSDLDSKSSPFKKNDHRHVAAARDVLVGGMDVSAAASVHQLFIGAVKRFIEKLLGNYITHEPSPAPEPPEPVVKSPSPAPAKGEKGISR